MDGTSAFGEQDSRPQPGSPMSGGGSVREPERLRDPENPRRGRLWSKVLWVLILIVSCGIFAMQFAAQATMVANPVPPPQQVPSMELRYAARVNFGMEKLGNSLGLPPGSAAAGDLRTMISNSSTGPIELVRAAIVAAAATGDRELAITLLDNASGELSELHRELEPLDDPEEQAEREQWFEDMRRDISDVGAVVSQLDATQLSQDELDRLEVRHGDFGTMIRIISSPDSDPLRQQFEERGVRTLISVFVMVGIAGLAVLTGFVLFVIAFVMVLTKKIEPRLNIQRQWPHHKRTLLLEAFLLFMLSFIAVTVAAGFIHAKTGTDVQPFLIWLMLLTPLWPLLRGMSWSDLHIALGWHANGKGIAGVFKEAALGFVGYLAGLPIVIGFIIVSLLLVFLTHSEPSHPATTEAMNADFMTALKLYVLASLWAPIVEESVFRGLLYYNMRRWAAPLVSGFVVAFLFAFIHPQGLALIPALMGLAVVFALVREWRGSLIGPMVAHGVHNAFVISLIIFVLGK
ncbi:MAG: CPBP family intramembrane glutamic endopeptidase [Phycisphaerales bacterium JB050]